jgi:hypothetical protein
MCDALMMYENGISVDKCACYSLAEREAKICFVLDLNILYKGFGWGQEVLLHLQPHQQIIHATMYV